jgi:ribose transport system ATP-binding protein
MRRFVADGGLIVFITHRIDEVQDLADWITILRSGRVVRTLARGAADVPTLLALMAPANLDTDSDAA